MEGPSPVPTGWATAHPVPVGWMRQFRYMTSLFDRVADIDGDVVECGLGEGNTFAMLAYLVGSEGHRPARTLWGFDSFEGFPEPSVWDASPRNPKKGEWRVGQEMIEHRLKLSGLLGAYPGQEIQITKGFLSETLPSFPDRPVVFLHLDIDLYEGYRDGLAYLFPRVVPGGVVLFDEYREMHSENPTYGDREKWPGCTKAVDEYFKDRPEKMRYDTEAKKFYIVKAPH